MRRRLIVMATVAVAAGSGCGGDSAEEDARNVVKEYATAIANGDERKACKTLSAASKERFKRTKTTCPEAYKNFGRFLKGKQKEQLRELDPQVKVDGEKATATVGEPPLEGDVRLTKENGEWRISTR
jgi:ribosomal protein L35